MAKKYSNLSKVLKKLLFKNDMRPVDLARQLNMPPPTIHRLVTGKSTRPYKSSLEPIAEFFDLSIEELLGEDDKVEAQNKNHEITSLKAKIIPVISWESIDRENKDDDKLSEITAANISSKSFALHMPDYSMEPIIRKDSILIFDPIIPLVDRCYVLVKLDESEKHIVRQLLIDADKMFIKSLNPDISATSIRLLSVEDKIIAKLVEIRYAVRF